MAKRLDPTEYDDELRAVGQAVHLLELCKDPERLGGIGLVDIRVKLNADNDTSTLVILKGYQGDERVIAFCGGLNLRTALLATSKKLRAGSLKWREDLPWPGNGQ